MTKQIRNTVRAAQLLQSLSGTGGNPLDALLSFLEPVLADFSGQEFDAYQFADAVRDAYGWDFNEDVADGLRGTLRARGWLKAKKSEPSNLPVYVDGKPVEVITYVNNPENLVPLESIEEILNIIRKEFNDFLTDIEISRDKYSLSDEQFIDSLVSWLLDNGTESSDGNEYSIVDDQINDQDQTNYLIARFVKRINERNVELSLHLRNIAAVGLLSELAQNFHKPLTSVKKSSLVVYLDSPIALDLLGASGDETAELTRSIISKLQSIGANIAVFSSSVREMQSILDALLLSDPNHRFGPSQEAIRRGEIDTGFLSSIRHDPEAAFKPFRVKVQSIGFERALKPNYYFNENQYNKLFEQLLNTQINQREKEKRCRHDAQASAWVIRLRKGHVHPDIFESGHIFLTRNRMFSALSRSYCIREELIDDGCVGPMVNMHDLAASLWLRTGLHNEVDLPKRQLLVGCQRVLALKRPVVLTAQRAILSLRKSAVLSEDKIRQIEAVLNQDRSLTLISDRVRGAREKIDENELIELAKRVMADEQQKGYFRGISDSAAEQAELRSALEIAQDRSEEFKTEAQSLADTVTQMREVEQRRVQGVVTRFNSWYATSRTWVRIVLVALAITVLALSIFKEVTVAPGSPPPTTSTMRWTIIALAMIPILLTFVDQIARLTRQERLIDKFVVDPWARKKLSTMVSDAGFTMADITACAVAPQLPINRVLNDFHPLTVSSIGAETRAEVLASDIANAPDRASETNA